MAVRNSLRIVDSSSVSTGKDSAGSSKSGSPVSESPGESSEILGAVTSPGAELSCSGLSSARSCSLLLWRMAAQRAISPARPTSLRRRSRRRRRGLPSSASEIAITPSAPSWQLARPSVCSLPLSPRAALKASAPAKPIALLPTSRTDAVPPQDQAAQRAPCRSQCGRQSFRALVAERIVPEVERGERAVHQEHLLQRESGARVQIVLIEHKVHHRSVLAQSFCERFSAARSQIAISEL
mmetsp:Transcript_19266/g.44998  ORF Transcript_19266/g.44998 Transcript_19266/m.44998 type:complete len:239 (+) Transcript_19266:784-1500(+)